MRAQQRLDMLQPLKFVITAISMIMAAACIITAGDAVAEVATKTPTENKIASRTNSTTLLKIKAAGDFGPPQHKPIHAVLSCFTLCRGYL